MTHPNEGTEMDIYEKAKTSCSCDEEDCIKIYKKMIDRLASGTSYGPKNYSIRHCSRDTCHTQSFVGFGSACVKCKMYWCDTCISEYGIITTKEVLSSPFLDEPAKIETVFDFFKCTKCSVT